MILYQCLSIFQNNTCLLLKVKSILFDKVFLRRQSCFPGWWSPLTAASFVCLFVLLCFVCFVFWLSVCCMYIGTCMCMYIWVWWPQVDNWHQIYHFPLHLLRQVSQLNPKFDDQLVYLASLLWAHVHMWVCAYRSHYRVHLPKTILSSPAFSPALVPQITHLGLFVFFF